MIASGFLRAFLALLFGYFAVCKTLPFQHFQLESKTLSKRQTLVNASNSQIVGIYLDVVMCAPYPVPVKVPWPAIWPRHVKLWRCMGSTYADDTFECGMAQEDHFQLRLDFSHTHSTLVPMTNHTACNPFQCIKKEKDCDNTSHVFDPGNCNCNCRDNVSCGPIKIWDITDCKCACPQVATACPGYEHTKIWDENSCQCECLKSLVLKCEHFGKSIDRNTCQCLCPPQPCPKGQVFQQTSCNCVNGSVSAI